MLTKELAEKVNVKVYNRVATVEMFSSEVFNLFDKEFIEELACKLKKISVSDDIDIVLLRGDGRVSLTDIDMNWLMSQMNENVFNSAMDCINELVVTLYSMSKLTISSISGAAVGLGLSLALATDYVIAEASSKFGMNFIDFGLIPDGGSHFFLDKCLGEKKAKQLIWSGKIYDAREALELGLIQELTEGDLQVAAEQRISDWLQHPIQAMIRTKKILVEKNRPHLLKMLELEKRGQIKMRKTADYWEGLNALREQRPPKFLGK